ncbi:MAG: TIM44-like domain-containing protein [Deltaproteobacteria bacterium]|nr:TIM44-like domain-containing protein [Deltaproteobacteria bacterium]
MVKNTVLVGLLSILFLAQAPVADARFGGGSSFGSRGSRSVAPRSSNSYGTSSGASRFGNATPSQPSAQPQPSSPYPGYGQPSFGGGGFMRGLMGGMAGSFLGSMLFRSMGYGGQMGGMGGGGGGFGLLEILLIGGLLFFVFRFIMGRAAMAGGPGMGYSQQPEQQQNFGRPDLRMVEPAQPGFDHGVMDEQTVADAIRRYDGAFDMARFKDSRVDDFFRIQAAWAQRDLTQIRPLVTSEIAESLDRELVGLKASGRINHIENVAVRETQIMEAWQEMGKEFVTLRFYANLLDYTVDELTGSVVEGDRSQPKKFEEFWTYVREVGRPGSPWLLTAIEQQS